MIDFFFFLQIQMNLIDGGKQDGSNFKTWELIYLHQMFNGMLNLIAFPKTTHNSQATD